MTTARPSRLRLVQSNNLDRFTREWRRRFAKGRIGIREEEATSARRGGDREEEARQFLAAARIAP